MSEDTEIEEAKYQLGAPDDLEREVIKWGRAFARCYAEIVASGVTNGSSMGGFDPGYLAQSVLTQIMQRAYPPSVSYCGSCGDQHYTGDGPAIPKRKKKKRK